LRRSWEQADFRPRYKSPPQGSLSTVSTALYLLVDFENVQPPPEDVARVRAADYHLWVFHGPHQNKFDAAMVNAWKPLGDRLQLVQSAKPGKNALDFHIAYYLGVLNERDVIAKRRSMYVVVTGDGGFDAIFTHMRGHGCAVDKAGSIPEALALAERLQAPAKQAPEANAIATPSAPRGTPAEENVAKIIAALASHSKSRPATRKKLEPYVLSRLGNKVTPAVVQAVVKSLIKRGVVKCDGETVTYVLPSAT
jgi:hypothetical protein